MLCPKCQKSAQKFGRTRDGQQRFRCKECRKTFSEPKPLPGKATNIDKAEMALLMLLEGASVRAVSRITKLDKNTILRLVVQAGQQCAEFLRRTIVGIHAEDVQCDEQWAFIYSKQKTADAKLHPFEYGDSFVFTAIERNSKLLVCFHVGKRSPEDTRRFADKLNRCIAGRPQISTDGFHSYKSAIPAAFHGNVDHGILVKIFGLEPGSPQRRYSPAKIYSTKHIANHGSPERSHICTSHVERHNLSNRMHNRRMTRLTNAFSKKWENHHAMFALWVAFYNYCRKHMTLKTTPAVAAGLATERWTLKQLLAESAKVAVAA